MSPKESVYELENSDEESVLKLEKLVRRKLEWRSVELVCELQSLDCKTIRARSECGKRMTVRREEGRLFQIASIPTQREWQPGPWLQNCREDN